MTGVSYSSGLAWAFGVLVVRLVYPRDTGSNPKTNAARGGWVES